MKVYFEDNEKMGEIKNALIDKDGGVTIIVSTEDDKRYKVKLNDDDAKLLIHMIHMKSIKDYIVNDISGIIIKTNDVEEIPVRGKRRETGIIDEDYSSYWSKMPYETKTSLYVCEEFINKDFPIEYDIPNLLLMDYDDYDIEFKSEISNKYSDVNPYITIGSTDCGKIVKIGDEVSIKNLIEFRKSNKITICTQEEIPFKLRFSITVKKFKYNK